MTAPQQAAAPARASWLTSKTGPVPNYLLVGGAVAGAGVYIYIKRKNAAAAAAAASSSGTTADGSAEANPPSYTSEDDTGAAGGYQTNQSAAAAAAGQSQIQSQIQGVNNGVEEGLGYEDQALSATSSHLTAEQGETTTAVLQQQAEITALQKQIDATKTPAAK
jgi:hypothetical protein